MMRVENPTRAASSANAVAAEFFQEGTEENGTPADKYGGGVEVGNGRTVLDIHAGGEPKGVDGEG